MGTPKYPSTGIHKLYLKSTQEHFFFDCPYCNAVVELKWPESFVLYGESSDDPACLESHLICYDCKEKLDHFQKREWLASTGRFIATNPEADPNIRGFHVSQLYSPTVSPGEIAVAYFRGIGDEAARIEFHNSKLGQPYIEEGSQVTDANLDKCISSTFSIAHYVVGSERIKTLGTDQGSFHHWAAMEWEIMPDRLRGDLNDKAKGKLIGYGKVRQDEWQKLHDLMAMYRVMSHVIDFFPDPTNARAMCREFEGYMWLCQYVVGRGAREVIELEDEYGANLLRVDKTSWMSKTLGRIISGDVCLPMDIGLEFRQHLKNQVRTLKKAADGNYQADYRKTGSGNDHWAHALCYNEIALRQVNPHLFESDIIT